MSIQPFQTNTELLHYSRILLRVMVGNYRKGMSICLRRNCDGSHAHFPALMTSVGFLDFLSGLYAGFRSMHAILLSATARKEMSRVC
jgi:hypothetical protein